MFEFYVSDAKRSLARQAFDEVLASTPEGEVRRIQQEIGFAPSRDDARKKDDGESVDPEEMLATYYALCYQMVRAGLQIPAGAPGMAKEPEGSSTASGEGIGRPKHTLTEYAAFTATPAAAAIGALAVPQYIGAPLANGLAVLFAGAAGIVFAGMWREHPQARRIVGTLGVLALLATIGTFGFQRIAAQSKPAMVAGSPQFRLLFLDSGNVFVYSPPGLAGSTTGITLDAKIWNTGTPSVVSSWDISVSPQVGDPVGGQSIPIKGPMHLKGRYGSPTITPSSSLEAKTEFSKVGQTPVEGTLLFLVPLPKSAVLNSKITLTAKDLYGNPYSTTIYMRELPKR